MTFAWRGLSLCEEEEIERQGSGQSRGHGRTERIMRTLQEKARVLILHSDLMIGARS